MSIKNYETIADALVKLFHPLVEVVIHDLHTQRIAYITGRLSKRIKGDESLIATEDLSAVETMTYPKINHEGKLIKSISVQISSQWLFCINCDLSVFSQLQQLTQCMMNTQAECQPNALFSDDWQEKIHTAIHQYLEQYQLKFECLTAKHKKNMVKFLYERGAFNQKKSVDYISDVLQMSRSTVFKHLKVLRG